MYRRRNLPSFAGTRTSIAATVICCLTCALLLALPARALDPNKRLTQYLHASWRIQDGSAPVGMFTVAQTSDGFLWFSAYTPDIYRFDGVQFLPRHFAYKGGPSNKVFKVFGSRTGGLWAIGSREIAYIKDGAVVFDVQMDGFSSFQNVSEAPDGSLWVVRAAANISDSALCHVTEREVKCFGKAEGVPIGPIDSILADGKGGFWLGGQTALVHWHDGASETYPIAALRTNVGQHGIVSVALGPDGTVWVGILAEGPGLGLGQLKEGVFKPFVTPTFDGSRVEVSAMTFDRDGSLWVAGRGKGLYRIHGNVVDHYGRTDGLSSDVVNLLFEDREGILWAATANGIDSFRDPAVTTFSSSEGLGKDAAAGVLASHDGSIWIANDGSLDRIVNGSISSLRAGAGLPGHQVASLLEDRAGNLWVGVDDSLYVLKEGRRLQQITGPDHKPLGLVGAITEDIDGDIWAATIGNPRKLVRIRDLKVREEFQTAQVPAARTLAPDPQGGIWIATMTGDLAHLRNGIVEKFALKLTASPFIRRIVVNADGSVLAATEDGLVGLRRGKVQRMTRDNGLPCSRVISFIEDKAKRWWLYADCGVLELADSDLQRWWSDPAAIVHARIYDRLDGAQPNAPYFNSVTSSPDGRVWFANGQVVQMVDPSTLSRKALPAPTYIESVIVDRRQFQASANLGLAPNPRDLQIDYTSPTFTAPQEVKFRYRLDPYDSDWHDAGTRRQALYTDLPPGNYAFRVAAANSDGVWNETPATLELSIAPAYYQTNWFRALCAALFLALFWVGYRLHVRRLQRRFELTLEGRVAERTRIARDLHDTLLQSFNGLLLRFRTVHELFSKSPDQARTILENAIEEARQALTEGRQAVQGLRSSTVETHEFSDAIKTLTEELASDPTQRGDAVVRLNLEGTSRTLRPLIRDEVYRIASEALRNAFRHAAASRIEVQLSYDEKCFALRVRDDGKGIDPKFLTDEGPAGHFGLRGMRERAQKIGGKLTLWSAPASGTELALSVPGAIAYDTAETARRSWLREAFAATPKMPKS
ncbi:MAG: two-component regulator propeller domain-containing protein [Steroidobacteraceae bacterium]